MCPETCGFWEIPIVGTISATLHYYGSALARSPLDGDRWFGRIVVCWTGSPMSPMSNRRARWHDGWLWFAHWGTSEA
jgi:hypothetical protein